MYGWPILFVIASGIGIGALPTQLAQRFINDQCIKTFDPRWTPKNMLFTASYLNDPRSEITHKAAILAEEIATQYTKNKEINKEINKRH